MKIIIQLSDANDYIKRIKNIEKDIFLLIIREENSKVTLKKVYSLQAEVSKEYLSYKISQSEKINVEIIGHSSTGGKQIQADKTEKYPDLHFICIDKLALWLEDELLQNNMSRSTISLLSCQAARGTSKFPALGAQLFELFKQKPEKVTARHGYVFIEKKIYSLGGFDTALKVLTNRYYNEYVSLSFWQKPIYALCGLVNKIYQHSKDTPMKEKVAYFEGMDNETRIIDKHLYDAHKIIERRILQFPNEQPQDIKELFDNKHLEDFSENDFIKIAQYGLQEDKNEKLHCKAKSILSSINKIHKAMLANTNINTFKKKNELLECIDSFKKELKPKEKRSTLFAELLETTKIYIEYRQARNYPIDEFFDFIDTLKQAEKPKNQSSYQKSLDTLVLFLLEMRSSRKIKLDTKNRLGATNIDYKELSFYKSIQQVTETKNKDFSQKIYVFLEKFDNEYSSKALKLSTAEDKKDKNNHFRFKVLCGTITTISMAAIILISQKKLTINPTNTI